MDEQRPAPTEIAAARARAEWTRNLAHALIATEEQRRAVLVQIAARRVELLEELADLDAIADGHRAALAERMN